MNEWINENELMKTNEWINENEWKIIKSTITQNERMNERKKLHGRYEIFMGSKSCFLFNID